jgi:hypothetical protein
MVLPISTNTKNGEQRYNFLKLFVLAVNYNVQLA